MAPFFHPSMWTQVLLRGALWLSVLWVQLSPVCCSHELPTWRFTTSELVIPRKVPRRMGGSDIPDQMAYSMHFRGQRHVLHMKLKKNLMPENLPVFTMNDQGAMQQDYPFIPQDCYFYSYLEGVPGSLATLDTCSGGLNGMLQVDDFTYEIKPLAASSKFEHVISLLVEERSRKSKKCRKEKNVKEINELLEENTSPRAAPVYLWRVHVKRVRVHYTLSASFTRLVNNFTKSLENVLIINSIVDSIYKLSGLHIYARAVCIWENRDPVNLSGQNATRIMENFGNFKKSFHENINPSTSVLITGNKLGNKEYDTFFNGICHPVYGTFYVYARLAHQFQCGCLMAHALGHNLGLRHDSEGCVCFRRSSCVMSESTGLLDMLSNCSHAGIHRKIHDWDICLSEKPAPYTNFIYEVPRCGDGKENGQEQCDCGTLKECSYNRCCQTNCRFTEGSNCYKGKCCEDCDLVLPGKLCRDKRGICDLPEYCKGDTAYCPTDVIIQDGTPCSALAVCMGGNCSDRDLQCQALFGYQVKDASPACYKQLNPKGDRFGNCGVKQQRGGSRPLQCQDDDIYCGLLHCDGVSHIPGGGEHTTFHHIRVQDVKEEQCFGYDVHHGTNTPPLGMVVSGATCGPGKYCKSQRCHFHQTLNFTCNVSKCHYRGVCNSRGNCHCIKGWQPPFCEEKGDGGSQDSGPPTSLDKMMRAQIRGNVSRILAVLFTRMILILASLLCGAIARAIIGPDSKELPPAK